MAAPKKTDSPTGHATRSVTVPRTWLASLLGLVLVPWLVVGLVFTGGAPATGLAPEPAPTASPLADGPWGRLSVSPIVISPPLEYISVDTEPPQASRWYLPGVAPDAVENLLISTGLDAQSAARVRAMAKVEPRISGTVVAPERDLVGGLSPDVRARLYLLLATFPLNGDQAHAYRFMGPSPASWLTGSLISPATRQLVEPLIYRDQMFMYFADLGLVRDQLADVEEVRRLTKTLLRQATVLVTLTVDSTEEVPALAEYWGRGGRKTDLRPLLESLAGAESGRSIDVVHLLPAFARNFLYRYPRLTAADFDKPVIANCLWTALNFFRQHPEDRFLDVTTALSTLKSEYYVVESGFQLGDVVAFLDAEGDIFHVVVYIADNLVLTKNGTSPMAPWVILPLDQVKGYYRTRTAEPRLIYHRRNDL